mmetsp:Transcript_66313/g.158450  ORF Transcript_66313/g.158450 Transcript_66313/m.158450 type:complete len:320 (+) Transcript_66313:1799-2758(+)
MKHAQLLLEPHNLFHEPHNLGLDVRNLDVRRDLVLLQPGMVHAGFLHLLLVDPSLSPLLLLLPLDHRVQLRLPLAPPRHLFCSFLHLGLHRLNGETRFHLIDVPLLLSTHRLSAQMLNHLLETPQFVLKRRDFGVLGGRERYQRGFMRPRRVLKRLDFRVLTTREVLERSLVRPSRVIQRGLMRPLSVVEVDFVRDADRCFFLVRLDEPLCLKTKLGGGHGMYRNMFGMGLVKCAEFLLDVLPSERLALEGLLERSHPGLCLCQTRIRSPRFLKHLLLERLVVFGSGCVGSGYCGSGDSGSGDRGGREEGEEGQGVDAR